MHKCITFATCKYVSECEGPSVRLLKTYKIKNVRVHYLKRIGSKLQTLNRQRCLTPNMKE